MSVRRRRDERVYQWLLTGFLTACIVGAGALLLDLLTDDTGVRGFLAGTALALVPLAPVLAALLWLDRYEPEPARLLLLCFAWGATVAALVATVVNTASIGALSVHGGAGLTLTTTVVAPIVEEAAKGSLLLLILWRAREEFDGVVDGIVLGGVTAVGFAFTENILYFGRAFLASSGAGERVGLFTLGVTFLLRGVLAPFAHPLFTACFGIGVGIAARTARRGLAVAAPIAGYLLAVMLHSAWNVAATAGLRGFVAAYLFFMVPMFVLAVSAALVARRREGRRIATELPAYAAAGWLGGDDVQVLADLPARRLMRELARQAGGRPAAAAAKEFQQVCTELAFLRARAARRGAAPDFGAVELGLLHRISQLRRSIPAQALAASAVRARQDSNLRPTA